MRIDPNTLMMTDLTKDEAKEVEMVVRHIMWNSTPPSPYSVWLTEWCNIATNGRDAYGLLMLATVFPAKALLSVLDHQAQKAQ